MNVLFKEYTKEDYKNTAYNDAKREVAKNLLTMNISEEIVGEATNLSREVIDQIKKDLK